MKNILLNFRKTLVNKKKLDHILHKNLRHFISNIFQSKLLNGNLKSDINIL